MSNYELLAYLTVEPVLVELAGLRAWLYGRIYAESPGTRCVLCNLLCGYRCIDHNRLESHVSLCITLLGAHCQIVHRLVICYNIFLCAHSVDTSGTEHQHFSYMAALRRYCPANAICIFIYFLEIALNL